ncbi:CRSP2 protein, partial [Crocuta crocuta]
LQRSAMGFWKFSPFLLLGILALYQVGMLQAAPVRSAMESPQDPAMLNEEELCLLLTAIVKDYVKMKASELQQEAKGSSITAQKSSCNSAPCVTHRLAGLLARTEHVVKNTFSPTSIGSEAFGHHHRELKP